MMGAVIASAPMLRGVSFRLLRVGTSITRLCADLPWVGIELRETTECAALLHFRGMTKSVIASAATKNSGATLHTRSERRLLLMCLPSQRRQHL